MKQKKRLLTTYRYIHLPYVHPLTYPMSIHLPYAQLMTQAPPLTC